jgi:hypothetical protein
MKSVRRLAELICLAILATGASAKAHPEVDGTSPGQVAQSPARDAGGLERDVPFPSKPVDEARRDAASMNVAELSGGPTGALLAGAALLTAAVILVAVLVRW